MKRTKPPTPPPAKPVEDLLTKLRELEETELADVTGAGVRCKPCNLNQQ